MAVHLFRAPPTTAHPSVLHLLAGYEDGRVVLFRFTRDEAQAVEPPTGPRQAGEGWVLEWQEKAHREAGKQRVNAWAM